MNFMKAFLASTLLLAAMVNVHAQDFAEDEPMAEINVADRADHIFTNFIVEYPKNMNDEAKKVFQKDILSQIENFYAQENPEMELNLCASDDLEAELRQLSRRLLDKTKQLTDADTTLWEHDFRGERYYFNFSMQVEVIPLEGSGIVSYHIMASDIKPWGEREKDFEMWRCYDMNTGKSLGLHDMLLPEGLPFLRQAITDFAVTIYLGEGGESLLVKNADGEIALPSEYDVALVPGMLNYSYPKDKLIKGKSMFGAVPAEMLTDYLTPLAKAALGL